MEKNVWVDYKNYEDIVNKLLIEDIGNCNRLSPEVVARHPHSMLQSLILLDILTEIKNLNEKFDKLSKEKDNVKGIKSSAKTK